MPDLNLNHAEETADLIIDLWVMAGRFKSHRLAEVRDAGAEIERQLRKWESANVDKNDSIGRLASRVRHLIEVGKKHGVPDEELGIVTKK